MGQRQQYRNRGDEQSHANNGNNGNGGGNKPVVKYVAPVSNGTIEVSVFENEYDGRNGKQKAYSTSVGRNYVDDNGKWTNGSKSFRSGDLAPLALLLQRAYNFILDQREVPC
jgi:hypothetical protein